MSWLELRLRPGWWMLTVVLEGEEEEEEDAWRSGLVVGREDV